MITETRGPDLSGGCRTPDRMTVAEANPSRSAHVRSVAREGRSGGRRGGRRTAARRARRLARPWRASGSRWQPASHSFHARTNIRRSSPAKRSRTRSAIRSAQKPKVSALALTKIRAPSPSRAVASQPRSEEHTSELQSQFHLVCRLLLEKKKKN